MHSVTRFDIKDKLASRYVRPFDIIEKVDDVTYCLNLPAQLGHVHNVFYMSVLKKYTLDLSHGLPYTNIPL